MPQKSNTPITRAQLFTRMLDFYNTNTDLPTSDHESLAVCIYNCDTHKPLVQIVTQFNTIMLDYEARQRAIANAKKFLDETKGLVEKLNTEQQRAWNTFMFDIRMGCANSDMKTQDLNEKVSALKAIMSTVTSSSDQATPTPAQ